MAAPEPLLPGERRCWRRRALPLCETAHANFYVLRWGYAWRLVADGFPSWRAVYCWSVLLRDGRAVAAIIGCLAVLDREWAGREASPTAAVIDSQGTNAFESGGALTWPCQGVTAGQARSDRLQLALDGSAYQPWSRSRAESVLERFPFCVNRLGFPFGGKSDSRCLSVKEADGHGVCAVG